MGSDQWFGNVDGRWDFPPMRRLLQRLASFARLVVFDHGVLFAATYPERTTALMVVNGCARMRSGHPRRGPSGTRSCGWAWR